MHGSVQRIGRYKDVAEAGSGRCLGILPRADESKAVPMQLQLAADKAVATFPGNGCLTALLAALAAELGTLVVGR